MAHSGKVLVSVFREFSAAVVRAGGGVFAGGGGAGRWAIILWGLDTFLMFSNFLISKFLSRFAAREGTRIYRVYK